MTKTSNTLLILLLIAIITHSQLSKCPAANPLVIASGMNCIIQTHSPSVLEVTLHYKTESTSNAITTLLLLFLTVLQA